MSGTHAIILAGLAALVSMASADSYGRGAGYATAEMCIKSECTDAAEPHYLCDSGARIGEPNFVCEPWGALYYPKCREAYHSYGCCICSNVRFIETITPSPAPERR